MKYILFLIPAMLFCLSSFALVPHSNLIGLGGDGFLGRVINTEDRTKSHYFGRHESYQLSLNYSRIFSRKWQWKIGENFVYNRFEEPYFSPNTSYNHSTYWELKTGPVLNFSFQDEDPGFMKSTFLGLYFAYGRESFSSLSYQHLFLELELGQRFLLGDILGNQLSYAPSISIREEQIKTNRNTERKIHRTSSTINFIQFDFVF